MPAPAAENVSEQINWSGYGRADCAQTGANDMPRDDWAKARNRDAAKRGTMIESRFRKRRNRKKSKPRPAHKSSAGIICHCGSSDIGLENRTFKDGSKHIEVRCRTCKAFLKWL